ncbi:hypothetical protein BIW11_05265 [Tropilaelaps mercedesae]|uniref:Uncharacterized protein n=1 Tax=Tropilaelaps mercedesae TaxID=418985 RepID=A0A1V9Y317_9ACAR|nr:hypothetical protein BIW11_05265 [Tropilaelaps mercedesae]
MNQRFAQAGENPEFELPWSQAQNVQLGTARVSGHPRENILERENIVDSTLSHSLHKKLTCNNSGQPAKSKAMSSIITNHGFLRRLARMGTPARANQWRPLQTALVSGLLHLAAIGLLISSGCDALEVQNGTMEYPKSDTEYRIQDDIIVRQGGVVIVHPGVSLYFEPGIGISVKEGGVIIANVSWDLC